MIVPTCEGAERMLRPSSLNELVLPKLLVWSFERRRLLWGALPPRPTPIPDSAVRQKLVQAILSEGQTQQKLLNELAESGAKVVHDVLSAWTRDGVYLYDGARWRQNPDPAGRPTGCRRQGARHPHYRRPVRQGCQRQRTSLCLRRFERRGNGHAPARVHPAVHGYAGTFRGRIPRSATRRCSNSAIHRSPLHSDSPGPLAKETNAPVRRSIDEAIALLQLADPDPKVQIAAVQQLAELKSIGSLDNIKRLMNKPGCPADVVKACQRATHVIEQHISFVNFIGTIFHGLSLGSILLVVALGLAITFGLMGIINMAHGEMIAVGAYTCYVVQKSLGRASDFPSRCPFSFGGKMLEFRAAHSRLQRDGLVVRELFSLRAFL